MNQARSNQQITMLLIGSKGVGMHIFLEKIVGKEKRDKLIKSYDGYNFINSHSFNFELAGKNIIISCHILEIDMQSNNRHLKLMYRIVSHKESPLIIIFMFDVTNQNSLEEVILSSFAIKDGNRLPIIQVILLGNKNDLNHKTIINSEIIFNSIANLKKNIKIQEILYQDLNFLSEHDVQNFFNDYVKAKIIESFS